MIRTLDPSMLNLPQPIEELAPLAAQYGFQAVSATPQVLADKTAAERGYAALREHGLSWGLMPMPADFYHWDLDDTAFEKSLEALRRQAHTARALGVAHAYNHVWPCSPRTFDENFQWVVERVRAVNGILRENGIRYGLEFLGPHELRGWAEHPFIHSLAGALAIAEAAGDGVGIAFDVYHWYCSTGGALDDVLLMERHMDRLVAVHLSDGVPGRNFTQQKDMDRRLPGETGVINAKAVLTRFRSHPSSALYMAEPFKPWGDRLHDMPAEDAVKTVSEALAKVE